MESHVVGAGDTARRSVSAIDLEWAGRTFLVERHATAFTVICDAGVSWRTVAFTAGGGEADGQTGRGEQEAGRAVKHRCVVIVLERSRCAFLAVVLWVLL